MDWKRISNTKYSETAALEIVGVGCVIGHTTDAGGGVSQSMCFVPGVRVVDGVLVKETRSAPQLGGTRGPTPVDEPLED